MHKKLYSIVCIVSLMLFNDNTAQAKSVEIPIATWGSPTHVNIKTFVPKLEEELMKRTNGRITVKHYPSGQLADDAELPLAVPMGKVKMGWVTLAGWIGLAPDAYIGTAPLGLTMEQMAKATDGTDGIKAVLNKQLSKKGVRLLAVTDNGPHAIVSSKRILTPEDIINTKIRVPSPGDAELVKALGGSPIILPFSDVYPAMQRGTINAAIIGFPGIESQKMYEVGKYALVPASFAGTGLQGWVANAKWWDDIEDDDRNVIATAVREAELYSRSELIKYRNELTSNYRKQGMEVTILTPQMSEYAAWKKATQPIMEQASKTLSAEIMAPIKRQLNSVK